MSSKANEVADLSTRPRNRYPNSFLFGFTGGVFLQMVTRMGSHEPLAARPFSYLTTGLVLAVGVWYYDYWRRRAMEDIMIAEQQRRYHMTLKALHMVRAGEEEEITNLVEYLKNSTSRE